DRWPGRIVCERDEGTLPEPHRASAGHSGPVDPTDAAVGCAARLWHQRCDSFALWRDPAGRYWLPVSSVAPPRKAEVDRVGVEDFRQQSTRKVLPPDGTRQETIGPRAFQVGAAAGSYRRRAETVGIICEVRRGQLVAQAGKRSARRGTQPFGH